LKDYYVNEWDKPTKRGNFRTLERPWPGPSTGTAGLRAGGRRLCVEEF